ncbi:hypothetical protein [Flagellimonas meishanensis]|uniref:hypothetical protein n=1 Tax=Flagellimonas meishanensis TaxID=2873264 RepID=UPI001CA6E420|nr:hypothetical protein [[Muricauda] meishanensis]
MRTRDLLRYLEKLEIGLSNFSYEELGIVEAGELKRSFEIFRNGLEEKVFGADEMNQLEHMFDTMGIEPSRQQPPTLPDGIVSKDREALVSLIGSLEKTGLNAEQKKITEAMKSLALGIESRFLENKSGGRSTQMTAESSFVSDTINLKLVLEECMGQMELLEELIKRYKHNILEFIGCAKVNLDMENFKEMRTACQRILPTLKMMRINGLTQIVSEMDHVSKTDMDLTYLGFLYDQFLEEFPRVEAQVDSELNALKTM